MAMDDKIPPAGLHPHLVTRLLDNLQGNDAFRAQFQESPEKALRSLGYTDPWDCMQLTNGKLASPEQIRTQRTKLEESLMGIHGMLCPMDAQTTDSL